MPSYRIAYCVSRDGFMRSEVDVFPGELTAQHAVDHLLRNVDDGEECRVVNVWVSRNGRWEIVEGWE